MLNIKPQNLFRKSLITCFAFVYVSLSLQVLKADDIDIYTRAVSFGKGGDPVMTFVIDTSGSMGQKMVDNDYSTYILDDRMFQLKSALRDQLTAMKGSFSVGLFSYDANDKSGNLEMEAKRLKGIENSNLDSPPPGSGTEVSYTAKDVAWIAGGAARDNEDEMSFPVRVKTGGRSSLGDTVNGVWQNSGGQDSDPDNGSYDYAGNVAGNKVVKYFATSNNNQTFWLIRDGNGSSPDPYLYILDSSGNIVLHSNDNRSEPSPTCPNGWTYNGGSQAGKCHREVEVNCEPSGWGGQTCDYEDQYQDPTMSGGNINSRIRNVNLSSGQEYTIVMGTASSNQSGNFTLNITRGNRGYFFVNEPSSVDKQSVAFRFDDVEIPKGASISSAYIVMESDEDSDSQTLDVLVDQSLTPDELSGVDLENGRSWYSQPSKFVSSYDSGDKIFLDVESLMNAKLNQSGWCGGEDMVFMIEGKEPSGLLNWLNVYTGPDPLVIESEEGGYDPRLVVQWSHGGGNACYTKNIDVRAGAIGDDVRQSPDGTIYREEEEIDMGQGNKAGLRFGFIGLPNAVDDEGNAIGLDIAEANLHLVASSNSNPGTIFIRAIQQGLAQPFTSSPLHLNERPLGDTIEWTPEAWNYRETYTSPNLSSIIQPLLEQEDWEYQGTIGFVISASSIESTEFFTFEENDGNSTNRGGQNYYNWNNLGTLAPRLTLTANASVPFENGDAYRKDLFDKLMTTAFQPSGGTPIAGSYIEAAEYMLGEGSYDSPLDEVGKCQSNTLVLLTDGDDTAWGGNDEDFEDITDTNCSGNWGCSFDLAEALKEGPKWFDPIVLPDDDGTRAIKTYTIGYGPIALSNTGNNLKTIANYGDGQYYPASDATKLANAFESIIGSVSDAGASISVPGVAVSAFNRITVLDEVYYSLFKPSVRRNWAGNAKRYRLHDNSIRDINGNEAINLDSTYFEDEAHSWWSSAPDGTVVGLGGAAGEIDPATRNVFTYKGANGASLGSSSGSMKERGLDLASNAINIRTDGDELTPEDLGMGFLGDMTPAQTAARKAKIVQWLQGGTADNPRTEMGAPLHSSPVLIGYEEDGGDLVNTIFVSTNEGYLHGIDTGEPSRNSAEQNLENRGGTELFSFVPKETLRMAAALEENAVVDFKASDYQHAYGLDSSWTYWREGGDDNAINAASDHVYLYGGMRRGGRMVYGLNVSDTYYGGGNNPKLLFAVGNSVIDGPTPVTGDPAGDVKNYNDIGQTWSVPRVRKTNWDGEEKTVLLFGGGYDELHDDPDYDGTGEQGSQVYMLDAENGELLWAASTPSSIVARITPFDRTGDVFFDSFYAVDLQGRVLRFDMNDERNNFVQHEIANLGGSGANNRKFYSEPGVALFRNKYTREIDMVIAVGSGYRANPTNKTVQERFHLIFDRGAYTSDPQEPDHVITAGDLTHLEINSDTEEGVPVDATDEDGIHQIDGWMVDFDQSIGEKALGEPLIFNGIIMFTAYNHKETGSTTCTPVIGQSRLYVMDLAGKGNADIFGGDGAFIEDITPGISSGVELVPVGDKVALLVDKKLVHIGGGDGGGGGPGDPPDPEYEEQYCKLMGCKRRDLDRSTWRSETMSSDEGQF